MLSFLYIDNSIINCILDFNSKILRQRDLLLRGGKDFQNNVKLTGITIDSFAIHRTRMS